MKAAYCPVYGPPSTIEIRDIPVPEPKKGEILIRVHASSLSSGDMKIRGFHDIPLLPWLPMRLAFGLLRPRKPVLGATLAGEVAALGAGVSRFAVGDRIFGSTGFAFGAHAEYVVLPEKALLMPIPEEISAKDAVAILFGGLTAFDFLEKGGLTKGQRVLIYGASGSVGTWAVQIAAQFGAHVTGVCSAPNMELVKSIGAAAVLDYTDPEFSLPAKTYDIIFDAGGKSTYATCLPALTERGVYLRAVNITMAHMGRGIWTTLTSSKKVIGGMAGEKPEHLQKLIQFVKNGQIKPIIGALFSLDEIVRAHELVESGHKQGTVVITMPQGNKAHSPLL